MRFSLILLLLPLAGIASAPAKAGAEAPFPSSFSVALEGALISNYGAMAEWRSSYGYAIQAEWFDRTEASGFLTRAGSEPNEDYRALTLNVGGTTRPGVVEIGGFVGAGYAEGRFRGKFLRTEENCFMFSCNSTYNVHDTLKLAGPIFPLTFFLGIGNENLQLRFAPHVYFAQGRPSSVLPFAILVRFR